MATAGTFLAPPPAETVVAELRQVIATELAPQVEKIDREGFYPAAAMQALGAAGAFAGHLRAQTPSPNLGVAIAAMAAISETCMSTGFCAWCQDALGWYLEQSENSALRARLQNGVATGRVLGGTGLSNPMKAFAGIERMKLRGSRVAGGYVVSGALPWVSNLGDAHWFGTVFEDADDPSHRIMGLFQCGRDGVEIRQSAHFVALEGTGTYAVMFNRAFIPDAALLADPLGDMISRIKSGFILLQTGMGLGVIQAAIDLMQASRNPSNGHLPRQPGNFAADLAETIATINRLAATPLEQDHDYRRAVLEVRLRVSKLTLESGQAALMHNGARGYLQGSAVNRRIREGHFVAIITPSIRHLRQELARMDAL